MVVGTACTPGRLIEKKVIIPNPTRSCWESTRISSREENVRRRGRALKVPPPQSQAATPTATLLEGRNLEQLSVHIADHFRGWYGTVFQKRLAHHFRNEHVAPCPRLLSRPDKLCGGGRRSLGHFPLFLARVCRLELFGTEQPLHFPSYEYADRRAAGEAEVGVDEFSLSD